MYSQRLLKASSVVACLVVSVGFAAGCSSPAAKPESAAAVGVSSSSGQSPQAQATTAERALLAAFASIPGAHVAEAPDFAGNQAYESWSLDKAAAFAFTAAAARLPHWPKAARIGGGGEARGQYGETVKISGAGTLATESVSITVIPNGARASTLQVGVEVDYRMPKPKAERVPDSSVLTITLQPVPGGTPTAAATKVITSRSTITQIATDINVLPTMPLAAAYCPMIRPSTSLALDFEPTASAPASASTVVVVPSEPAGICAPGVQVTVDGAREPELDDSPSADLFTQLEQLAGITR